SLNDERLFPGLSPAEWQDRLSHLTRDPLNHHPTTTRDGDVSLVELPSAPPLRWFAAVDGVPAGRVVSADVGDKPSGLSHAVSVYTPAGYSSKAGARN